MKEDQSTYQENDEITLKELIIKIRGFYKELLGHWKFIVLFTIPFVLFMLYKAFSTPLSYPATLTFMVNENEGNSLGGVSAILGGFLGGGSGGKYNLDKILELAKSRKIIQSVMLEQVIINKKEDFLANHIIEIYKLHEDWEEDTIGLSTFNFYRNDIALFNKVERTALKELYKVIMGGESRTGLIGTGFSKESGIMRINVNTESEDLSIVLAKQLFDKLSLYYIEKSTEKQVKTLKVVSEKVDSIKNEMMGKEYVLAKFKDNNRMLQSKKDQLKEQQLARDIKVLNIMFGEALKNFEIADFSLKNETPFVQLIDEPMAPIEPNKTSKIKSIITGGFLGGFLASLYIILRMIYRETMKEEVIVE